MSADKIDDSVGKKIVEALKKQDTQIDSEEFSSYPEQETTREGNNSITDEEPLNREQQPVQETPIFNSMDLNKQPSFIQTPQSFVDNAFQQSLERNLGSSTSGEVVFPTNVEVLRRLISKLPTGVSKQTGALIIKQTMEALGISMQNVLSEARQVQSDLNTSARECQASIVGYRQQITMLENKMQQCQKEFAQLNDIISLFIQPSNK